MKPKYIIINGKFLTGAEGGVYRVAVEYVFALDKLLDSCEDLAKQYIVVLFTPKAAKTLPGIRVIKQVRGGAFSGEIWEQFDLPLFAKGSLILNFCNIGPIFSRNCITWIHDAQVFVSPRSYSLAFRIKYKVLQPIMCARHKVIVTVSAHSKNDLVESGLVASEKVSVIHNGVDHFDLVVPEPSVLHRYGLKRNKYVLALASVQDHKNIGLLLDVFSSRVNGDLSLVLYGSGSKEDFEDKGFQVNKKVQFIGRINDQELKGLMNGALCLAFPSKTEGFGLPPLEAMRAGAPVIVAPCGALPEVCANAALYADSMCAKAWSKAFNTIFCNMETRQRLITNGLEHSKNFRWDEAVNHLMRLVEIHEHQL